ncbi:MAG: hypothetical protein IKN72_08980 [Clostridia bacterium]|nr:hypothetical protein [Clostridia bacterium]
MKTEIHYERNDAMTNVGLPRMRTIPQAMKEIKALDPNTSITTSALRRMVKEGAVETVQVANKRLLNLDLLFDRLACYNGSAVTPRSVRNEV